MGLLILRCVNGIFLIQDGLAALNGASHHEKAILLFFAVICGVFLLLGLWSPVAGAGEAISELSIIVTGTDQLWCSILMVGLGSSLAMLGPGTWSIDSLLFGRQRIDLRER